MRLPSNEERFETFWSFYPRKVAKGAARKAFPVALRKIKTEDPFATLCEAVRLFAEATKSADTKFIPHGATWLNGERWEDDIEDVRRAYAQTRPDTLVWRDDRTGRMLQGFVRALD